MTRQNLLKVSTFNAKWLSRSLEVIYFGVNEKPLSNKILQYNVALYQVVFECLEDIVIEISENRLFDDLTVI